MHKNRIKNKGIKINNVTLFLFVIFHSKSCRLPVCNETCEKGDIHQLECDVFSSVIDYHDAHVTMNEKDEEETKDKKDDDIENEELKQLLGTFVVTKFDSPSPVYACITPLRMLLKCRQEMAEETLRLQSHINTKDDVDVSIARNRGIVKFILCRESKVVVNKFWQ